MSEEVYKTMLKVRYNMTVDYIVNRLEKDILNLGSKYIIEKMRIIEDINIISINIGDSVIQNKYRKIYKI